MSQYAIQELIGLSIPALAILGGFSVAIIAIISKSVVAVRTNAAREASRREIAAYVAEGSITPEDARALLEAGKAVDTPPWQRCGSKGC